MLSGAVHTILASFLRISMLQTTYCQQYIKIHDSKHTYFPTPPFSPSLLSIYSVKKKNTLDLRIETYKNLPTNIQRGPSISLPVYMQQNENVHHLCGTGFTGMTHARVSRVIGAYANVGQTASEAKLTGPVLYKKPLSS